MNGRFRTEEEALAAAIAASLQTEAAERAAAEAELQRALEASRRSSDLEAAAVQAASATLAQHQQEAAARAQALLGAMAPLHYLGALRARMAVGLEAGLQAAPAAAAGAAGAAGAAASSSHMLEARSVHRYHRGCTLTLVGQFDALARHPNAVLCPEMYRGMTWVCDACTRQAPGSVW